MFSKTPLQKLSLGAAGAIWLALGSVESANAASFKSFSTVSISQPLELASIRFGNGNARKNSSDNAIKAALIAGSVLAILFAAGIFDGDSNRKIPEVPEEPEIPPEFQEGLQVKTKGQDLISVDLKDPTSPKVPSPALLPGLLALGWKVMQKRRPEQSGAL